MALPGADNCFTYRVGIAKELIMNRGYITLKFRAESTGV